MRQALRITVPFDPMLTSANRDRVNSIRGGFRKARLHADARATARAAWLAAGSPTMAGKVRVSFVVRRGHSVDLANALGGLKPALDGLFTNAITPDDSPRYLAELGGVQLEIDRRFKGREEVEFVVESLETTG